MRVRAGLLLRRGDERPRGAATRAHDPQVRAQVAAQRAVQAADLEPEEEEAHGGERASARNGRGACAHPCRGVAEGERDSSGQHSRPPGRANQEPEGEGQAGGGAPRAASGQTAPCADFGTASRRREVRRCGSGGGAVRRRFDVETEVWLARRRSALATSAERFARCPTTGRSTGWRPGRKQCTHATSVSWRAADPAAAGSAAHPTATTAAGWSAAAGEVCAATPATESGKAASRPATGAAEAHARPEDRAAASAPASRGRFSATATAKPHDGAAATLDAEGRATGSPHRSTCRSTAWAATACCTIFGYGATATAGTHGASTTQRSRCRAAPSAGTR